MAEFVNQRIEDMLPELEQMKRIELYTPEEIREITRRRTDFEYKLHRQTRCKEDYLSYIAYECILLQNIDLRRKTMSITDKKSDIEYALMKRVRKIYRELVQRFPEDIQIWLNFIMFCKTVNFSPCITAIFESLLQVHSDKPRLWQLACRWEYEEMHSADTARKLAVKGLQRHPTCRDLYIDAYGMELLEAQKADGEEKITQLERANIIRKSAQEHIPDVSFIVELCSITSKYDFAKRIQEDLLRELWENYNSTKEAWEYIAKCELEGTYVGGFAWKTSRQHFRHTKCPENLANFVNVYETATEMLPHTDACNSYIKSAIKLSVNNSYDTVARLQILKRSLEKGHMLSQLTEDQYKLWMDLLASDGQTVEEDISKILEEACESLPESEYLWEERLKRNKKNVQDLIKIFKKAEKCLPPEKGFMLWTVLLENTKDVNKLKKLHEDSLRLCPEMSRKVKPIILISFYENGGIDLAREEYANMIKSPPFEMELHKTMINLELSQKISSYKHLKHCHEVSTHQFGKNVPEVWLDFIKFEVNNGHPELCGPLYKRACASLDRDNVDKFIVMYSLNKK